MPPDARAEIDAKLGPDAAERLYSGLESIARIDAHMADDQPERAFLHAKAAWDAGLGASGSRYVALALVLGTRLNDVERILLEVSSALPPGLEATCQAIIEARVQNADPSELQSRFQDLGKYLPVSYYLSRPRGLGSSDERLEDNAIWSLICNRGAVAGAGSDLGSRTDISVVDGKDLVGRNGDGGGGNMSTFLNRLEDTNPDPQAPVLWEFKSASLPERLVSILGEAIGPGDVAPILVSEGIARPDASFVAGEWQLSPVVAGVLCGSPEAAKLLAETWDKKGDVGSLHDAGDPIILTSQVTDESNEGPTPALCIAAEQQSGCQHGLVIGENATNREAQEKIAAFCEQDVLDERTPVVVISPALRYPSDYASFMTRKFDLNGHRAAVALAEVMPESSDWRGVDIARSDEQRFVCRTPVLALSCMALSDLLQTLEALPDNRFYDSLALPRLPAVPIKHRIDVVASNQRVLRRRATALFQDPASLQHVFRRFIRPLQGWISTETSKETALVWAFSSAANSYWDARKTLAKFVHGEGGRGLRQKLGSGIVRGWLKMLAEEGEIELVYNFLQAAFDRDDYLCTCGVSEFAALTDAVRALGAQSEFAETLCSHALAICEEKPELLVELFTFLAGPIPESRFVALVVAMVPQTFMRRQVNGRRVSRYIDGASRYCDDETIALIVEMISFTGQKEVIGRPDILAKVAPALLSAGSPDLYDRLDLSVGELRSAAPAEERLVAALASDPDKAQVATLLGSLADEDLDLVEITELIRAYSKELAELAITSLDWPYHLHGEPAAVLAMASTLKDERQITENLPLVADPELNAFARCAIGDFSALNALYDGLAETINVGALEFEGQSTYDLFKNLSGQLSGLSARTDGPLISVIMSTFNPDLELFGHAVDSVLNQTHRNIELFIVDDASDPENVEAIKRAAERDERITFIALDRNHGPYTGRNVALAQCSGEFVAIQDADDFAHPERFRAQLEQFAEHPQLALCAARHLRFDADGRLQIEHDFKLTGDGTMSSMYRRSVFDTLGPFASVRSRGDVEFRERVKKAIGPHAYRELECPLVFCFAGPATLSHSTARSKRQQLQDFRRSFALRLWRHDQSEPSGLGELNIPGALRP